MIEAKAEQSVRRTLPIRFGMRSLIVAITAFCVVLGLFLKDAARYSSKKIAVRSMIESVEGKIYVSESSDPPPGYNWLTGAFGLSNSRERLWRVYLANRKISPDQVALLHGCEWIRSLDLSGTNVGDDDLRFLTSIPKLREIQLNRTQVTDDLLPTLKSLDRLLLLETKGTSVTCEGLNELDGAFATPRYFADAKLARLFPLDGVKLSSSSEHFERLSDDHMAAKLSVKRTTAARISEFSDVSKETFALLRRFPGIREFGGFSKQERYDLFGVFRDLTEVQLISFSGGLPSDADIEDISKLRRLKYLWFFDSHLITEDAVRSLAQIETLEWLTLDGVHGSLRFAPLLKDFKNLRILSLSAIRQGNARRLSPEELDHTIELLRPLKDLPSLESLRISGNDMQDEVLLSLVEFRNIKQVCISRSLQGEFLSDEAIAKFRSARPDVDYVEDGLKTPLEFD